MRILGLDVIKHAKVAELTKKHSNLPERYIKRCMEDVLYQAPKLPQYRQVTVKRIKKNFSTDRPWQASFQERNFKSAKSRVLVEPIAEWSIFRGDRVEVLTGKDKGKQGIVVEIFQERNWVIVEGLNTNLECFGKSKSFPGMFKRVESPLLVTTDVSLVDPADLKPVKITWKHTEDGERVRVSDRSGRIIPISVMEEETYDYKMKSGYKEKKKDTPASEVTKVTFVPSLKTFEMSIMEEQGIKEDRVPAKSYWY